MNLAEQHQYFADKFLISLGAISGGLGLTITAISIVLSLILQITGLISFFCFLVINHERIVTEGKKLIRKVFKNGNKSKH